MTDRVLIVYWALKAAKRCFDYAIALTWMSFICMGRYKLRKATGFF
jgi:hypothetical protein